ncbi:hypothetical protein F4805DRAFT_467797 [Annulohypoxylon moriforme]|nr:hypothetical protein F4805DRAFT_467797 [Annulohypoxylon moriforme]
MLADLQKIQMHMHMFFTKFGQNQLDPEAGQTRPENLLILNDPDFVPDMVLPKFDLDALVASQATQKTSSQMSPLDSTILSGSHPSQSPAPGFDIRLDIHDSPSPGPGGSPFGLQGLSSAQKPGERRMLPEDDVFGEAEDWGIDIDEHGNIVESAEPAIVQDDFDLPPFPAVEGSVRDRMSVGQEDQGIMDDQGDVIMSDGAQQPDEAAAAQPPSGSHNAFLSDDHVQRQAPSRRKRKPRTIHADEQTQIARTVINGWQDAYLENCGGTKIRPTGAAKAKANAMLLTFGLGLGNIGQNIGVPGMIHPLALDFSGDSLFTAITGLEVPALPHGRGRRRSASESIEEDEEQGRRVRPRLGGDDVQLGRSMEGDDVFANDGQQPHDSPEVGRAAQAAMSDHLSSALNMPWNRGSSNMPGSSIRGSAQKGRIPSSPLAGRGHQNIQDIAHFSDAPSFSDGGGGDFDLGGLPSDNDAFDGFHLSPRGPRSAPPQDSQQQQKTDYWPTLDIEGKNFLSFMHSTIRENGERRLDEDFDIDRRWIAFEDVFVPRDTNRMTAAQAFFHVLALATKGRVDVLQDVVPEVVFGGVWVGVKMGDVGGEV